VVFIQVEDTEWKDDSWILGCFHVFFSGDTLAGDLICSS
jgi:hypothetical protein